MRTAAQLRGRLGEDREAGDAGRWVRGSAQLGVELATGDDHADVGLGDVFRHLVEQELRGLHVDRRDRRQRATATAAQREWVSRRHCTVFRQRCQRLAEGEVEVDRPGTLLAPRGGKSTAGGRTVVEESVVVGVVGADVAEPAHRGAVELDLVDRLASTDSA